MLTSYNWLFLTDFITIPKVYSVSGKDEKDQRLIDYKPTYIEESSWNLYNMFFGEHDNNKRWYIAPERCLSKTDFFNKTFDSYLVQPSMDVFSVGWVIAEIFLDGKPLFDLARHQLYRKGQFNPKDILCMIDDDDIEMLITDMISLDPQNRKSIATYLYEWNDKVFPQSFSSLFFQLGSIFLKDHMLGSDNRIAMIRKYIDAAWMAWFDEEIGAKELLVPTNIDTYEYLKYEILPDWVCKLIPKFDWIILHSIDGEREISPIQMKNSKVKNVANDSMLVLVIMIGIFINSSK